LTWPPTTRVTARVHLWRRADRPPRVVLARESGESAWASGPALDVLRGKRRELPPARRPGGQEGR